MAISEASQLGVYSLHPFISKHTAMATLHLLLKTLELVEEIGNFADFLSTPTAVLLIICLISNQLLIAAGYPPLTSAIVASLLTILLNHSGYLRKGIF
ncbi:MAG: hypothetical protein F6K11_32315 [Leptolyngbya sp. SIO3F4]|nr:hypothetical protein [Leptolyngbya sp. SIO3F4]